MSIGYACLGIGVPDTDFKSCVMKNAGEDRLLQVIAHNLASLENLIDYNCRNDIRLFRISSDIIPFGSSPVNTLAWRDIFEPSLTAIGDKIRAAGMRVSMHPGQYTILNSPNEDTAARAAADLIYHARFLDAVGTGRESKIILHIGGVYGDKKLAVRRFEDAYSRLDESVKSRLVLENDEKSYDICDVLDIARRVGAPVVFDTLHHKIHPCKVPGSEIDWIRECQKTWTPGDGRQKIHYSQQDPGKRTGSHSESIQIDEFLRFYENIRKENPDMKESPDIMLEVKDKNLSAVKCINCTSGIQKLSCLELDWSRYKYLTLEKAPAVYQKIRELLKDRETYPALEFYHLVEQAMKEDVTPGNAENAALHVWGYFKKAAADSEKERFARRLSAYRRGEAGIAPVKNCLLFLAKKYDRKYLLDSLYFYL